MLAKKDKVEKGSARKIGKQQNIHSHAEFLQLGCCFNINELVKTPHGAKFALLSGTDSEALIFIVQCTQFNLQGLLLNL